MNRSVGGTHKSVWRSNRGFRRRRRAWAPQASVGIALLPGDVGPRVDLTHGAVPAALDRGLWLDLERRLLPRGWSRRVYKVGGGLSVELGEGRGGRGERAATNPGGIVVDELLHGWPAPRGRSVVRHPGRGSGR